MPQNIGIYGCSAGGMLTGMAVAWFQKHDLPRPGAVGILCAGMTLAPNGFGGDAAYTTAAIGESRAPPPLPKGDAPASAGLPYFAGVSDQRSTGRARKFARGAREVSADAHRHGHAWVRAQLRRPHACAAGKGRASKRTCTSGKACSTASSTTWTFPSRATATTSL